MSVHSDAEKFILDLKININEIAEGDSISLWNECQSVAEPASDRFDEMTLSVLCRMQQGTYYKALDTFVEALKITLLGSADEEE